MLPAKDRLAALQSHFGMSLYQMANILGISKQNLYNISWGKTKKIPDDLVENLIRCFPELNKVWLMTGEGDMLNGDQSTTNVVAYTDDKNIRWVPLLPVYAHGGQLSNFAETVNAYECDMIISPVKDADFAITVVGESMAPEFPSGCQILIKRYDGSLFVDWGRPYVLDTANGVIIKRLMPSTNPDYIHCVSINPDPLYAPFDVPRDCIIGMYSVVMMIARK